MATKDDKTVVLYARRVSKTNHVWLTKQAKKAGVSLTQYVNNLVDLQRKQARQTK